MRFLVVEDNPSVADLVRRVLKDETYEVDVAGDATHAWRQIRSNDYDSIILDLMLPGTDGVTLCRELRDQGVDTPIMMLTALSSTEEKVKGLDAGADDYLTKPFEVDELLARTRCLLRRRPNSDGMKLKHADLVLDMAKRVAYRGEREIGLTAKEYAILEYLIRNPNIVLSRARIGEHVWGMDFEESSNVIEVYISRLRGKIDRGFESPFLNTVIGMGYILSEQGPPVA